MRVLLINDFYVNGGAETVYRETETCLSTEQSIEVRTFYGSEYYKLADSVWSYLFSRSAKKLLKETLHDFSPEIIHIHGYYHILSPSIFLAIRQYRKYHKVKVLYTAHDYNFLYPNSALLHFKGGQPQIAKPKRFPYFFLDKVDHRSIAHSLVKKLQWILTHQIIQIRREIDLFVSPSNFLMDLFQSNLDNVDIELVRNPVELVIKPIERKLSVKPYKLIYFGRISREKGLIEMLKGFSKITDQDSYNIDIYGSGEQEPEVSRLIRDRHLKNVNLKGHVSRQQLMPQLANYDAMLIPSVWYENAPMTIMEAASQGLVIIGSNLGGIVELAKLTKSYVLIDDWQTELKSKLEIARELDTNEILKPEEFSLNNYQSRILNIYEKLNSRN